MFKHRLGAPPSDQQSRCSGGYNCPDILEMDCGDFAVIGADITEAAQGQLPPGSGCGPDERVVRIPRRLLVAARADIPATL